MRLEKCPRCELNYVRPGEKLCEVCKREMRGVQEPEETLELCPECGEHPVVAGEEYCVYCLREHKLQEGRTLVQDDSDPEDDTLEEPSELLPVVDVIEQIEHRAHRWAGRCGPHPHQRAGGDRQGTGRGG